MDLNKNCSACNIKIDRDNYKKDRTVCKDCYNIKKQKYNKKHVIQNNNRTLIVGPSFSGKTYLMLKILSQIRDRDIYIITKSPPEQYSSTKSKLKKLVMRLNL